MNRRGFLKGLLTAVAVVAVEVKLATREPTPQASHLRWAEANSRYDYGIDPNDPLDVVIHDNVAHEFIDPHELMRRWHEAPNPNSYGDEYDKAYEATAMIAMSQGSLMYHLNRNAVVTVPSYAQDVVEMRSYRDCEIDRDDALPWIATA